MSQSSHRWQSKPGSWDVLHAEQLFPSHNDWGIPTLPHVPMSKMPTFLIPYRQRIRANAPPDDGAVHFFLDDYRFETVWSRPHKALQALFPYPTLLSPDFSLYRDYPLSLQLWNVYRNRWCGCFWVQQGFTVIPTVSWSDHRSYDFCFAGIPRHSVVAIGIVGVDLRHPLDRRLFLDGFCQMVDKLQPSLVLSYGPMPAECRRWAEILCYPTRWQNIRAARRDSSIQKGR
jgi:hypothetical protein